jgi:hypothetical integral membrane protein (TIGR02206 family)
VLNISKEEIYMDLWQYFARDYRGAPFILFGTVHLLTLVVVAVFIVSLTFFRGASELTRSRVRWTLAITLWLNELAWHVWNIAIGTWTPQTLLPLQLCNVLVWLTGFTLLSKNQTLYEFSYFLGIAAASQSIFTPDAGMYGFPHFRYIQPIISHGLLVAIAVYLTVVEGMRPTWKAIPRIFAVTNLYMLFLYFFNSAIGSNYMMVNYKPDVVSLFSLMPGWPWYILWSEGIALVLFLLLYLPFAIKDWRAVRMAKVAG